MVTYSYTARDDQGKVVKGTAAADDESDLFNRLSKGGLILTSARVANAISFGKSPESSGGGVRLSQTEVLNFTTQLAISLEAGVPLLTVLKDLGTNSGDKKMRRVMSEIARKVETGTSFKDALTTYRSSFTQLYISIVGAGESTGKLPMVLNDLARMIEWQLELQSKIKEAMIYPIVMFVAMVGVVTVLMTVVIPKFIPMFESLKLELPLPTKIVLGASKLWWLPFVVGGVCWAVYFVTSLTAEGRYKIAKITLKLPVVGDLVNKIALSRFCHTLALSLKSGITVINALGIASEVTGNAYLERAISKAKNYVNVGEKISVSLDKAAKEAGGGFPDLIIRMVSVGETSGSLAETLEKVNQFYDKEVPATIKKIFAMMEPAMIMVMGGVVGGIAVSVFLPLVKVIGGIGGD